MQVSAQGPSLRAYFLAAGLTAGVSVALPIGIQWLAPWSCDVSAWLCLTTLSVFGFGPVAALALPVLHWANRRRAKPFADGWGAVVLATGGAGQVLVTVYSLWLFRAYLAFAPVLEVLMVPFGFVAGMAVGAVFQGSLTLFAPRQGRPA